MHQANTDRNARSQTNARLVIIAACVGAMLSIAASQRAAAQPVFSNVFPVAEYAARRASVMTTIGDGVAIILGTTERPGEQPLRQGNQFSYLSGAVEPRAILVLDGRTKKTTLYLQPYNQRREERAFGALLHPGDSAATITGVDAVIDRAEFTKAMTEFTRDSRKFFTPFRPEVLGSASSSDPVTVWNGNKNDPWDGRVSREEAFIQKLKAAAPNAEVANLDPIIDRLRDVKSAREIEVIREATRITGLGIMEAMRDARPGQYEYELQADAEFVFKKYGAYGASYFALIGTGVNTWYSHYHKNTAKLADGDLVQFDYAPDYKNYQSDVTRVFPANGKFTPWQREYYGIYLKLYQALMTSIKVHVAPRDVIKAAVVKMDSIMATYRFTDPRIKAAAVTFVDNYRNSRSNSLGHSVGLEVHDVRSTTETLEPGQIFTIEPAMLIPELHLGIRLEDMLLITPAGYENLSAFVPIEIEDIEAMMKQPGLSDAQVKLSPRKPRD